MSLNPSKAQSANVVTRPKNVGNKYVTKYRRTKNLVKKCSEISKQCDLDFILVMRDKKNNRIREVHTSQQMTLDDLNRMINENSKYHTLKYKREYTGDLLKDKSKDQISGNGGRTVVLRGESATRSNKNLSQASSSKDEQQEDQRTNSKLRPKKPTKQAQVHPRAGMKRPKEASKAAEKQSSTVLAQDQKKLTSNSLNSSRSRSSESSQQLQLSSKILEKIQEQREARRTHLTLVQETHKRIAKAIGKKKMNNSMIS